MRSAVENCIDASELLENHDPAANAETLEHVRGERCAPGTGFVVAIILGFCLFVEENGGFDFEILGKEGDLWVRDGGVWRARRRILRRGASP